MGNKIDKELVRRRFARSFSCYDREAVIQQKIAGVLARSFSQAAPTRIGSLLEVGCGTGFLTAEIVERHSVRQFYINDIVEEALPSLAEKVKAEYPAMNILPVTGDAEDADFPGELDAVVSASAVQWFDDLPAFVTKAAGALNQGGIFAFNSFGPQNLHQIKALTGEGLDYFDIEETREMLGKCFRDMDIREEVYGQIFESPVEVLRHLRRTGVTGTGKFKWTKSKLARFEKDYLSFYGRNGKVELTWHVIYAVCVK